MSFSEDLIRHAIRLLGNPPGGADSAASAVDLRRAVSASYYALFHHLSEAAVFQIAPHVGSETANRIHRWFDHSEIKRICREFAEPNLRSPLRELLGTVVSHDMLIVAINFIKLQEARQSADYDLQYQIPWGQAQEHVTLAENAIHAWEKVSTSAEANIFILSLLMWKNWQKDRP